MSSMDSISAAVKSLRLAAIAWWISRTGFSQFSVVHKGIMFRCPRCADSFGSARGLGIHYAKICAKQKEDEGEVDDVAEEEEEEEEEEECTQHPAKMAKLEHRVRVLGDAVRFLLAIHIHATVAQ